MLIYFYKLLRDMYFLFYISTMEQKKPKIYTPAKFAVKNKISRTTVWRWLTDKKLEKRLKMYDAKKIVIADKVFIEVA